ncbi:MAG: hypothetical protein KF730_02080 [Sphingomonas sp.]|uniref:hypothetical protein n=1 Tax=Sphingomonas sp. TaxID=28214 RepID=UPI0025D79F61|nr:hypothetical protein [Sphingomonas sp.]MBX3563342.1 hypothetical protein [Sphingomonas sp.]
MAYETDQEIAERLTHRRARVLPAMALIFLSGQAIYFGNAAQPMRAVDATRISAWLVWALALLLLLATGGGLFRSRKVRALLNDELSREHRLRAIAFGFWAAMLTCVAAYILSAFEPVTAREAIHRVLTLGVGAALLRFGMLERRALKDG